MEKITIKKLIEILHNKKFMDGIKTISIIHNDENRLQFAVYFDDLMFMSGYETEVNINIDDCTVDDWRNFREIIVDIAASNEIKVFHFSDKELTEAWKNSYIKGGITSDRWDRRTIFHKFNEPNELFCIDEITYYEIIGESRYGHIIPKWKQGIIDWYHDVELK